jgi:hypothetical protein
MIQKLLPLLLLCALLCHLNCRRAYADTHTYPDHVSQIETYPREIIYNNETYLSNVMLVWHYDSYNIDSRFWILRAAWVSGGLVVQIETARRVASEARPDNSYIDGLRNKTARNYCASTRFVRDGEMRFLEKSFIQSLPLLIVVNNWIISEQDPLYFRVSPEGPGLGGAIGDYDDDDSVGSEENMFPVNNPGYAKLYADFRSAAAWVFPEWLAEDGHRIKKPLLAEMRKYVPKRRLDQDVSQVAQK